MRTCTRIRSSPCRSRRVRVLGGLVALLQVVGWGLLWSAVCSQALTAAVLAVCSAGLVLPLLDPWLVSGSSRDGALVQLAIGMAAMLASAVLFIRSGPPIGRSSRSAAASPTTA